MFCRYCGNEIPANSIFCEHCGKKQARKVSQQSARGNTQQVNQRNSSGTTQSYQYGSGQGSHQVSNQGQYQAPNQGSYGGSQQGQQSYREMNHGAYYDSPQNQQYYQQQRKSANSKGLILKAMILVLVLAVAFIGGRFVYNKIVHVATGGVSDGGNTASNDGTIVASDAEMEELLRSRRWIIGPMDEESGRFVLFDFEEDKKAVMYIARYDSYPGPIPGFIDSEWRMIDTDNLIYWINGMTVTMAPAFNQEDKIDFTFEVKDGLFNSVTISEDSGQVMVLPVYPDPDTL